MARFRILSLLGGGVRGAFGAAFLNELEKRLEHPLVKYFDLLAGTSTGAISAAGLAAGMTGGDLVEFYQKHVDDIFHPREPHEPKGWLKLLFPAARSMFRRRTNGNFDDFFRARYCPHALRYAFEDAFGQKTLSDLRAGRLIIPSVNLTRGQTCIFRTPHLIGNDQDSDVLVADVLRAATAAPTYFPHMVMPDGDAYCDGGLWANNPGVLAVAEAIKIRRYCDGPRCDPAFDVSTIQILSIGTGITTYSLSPPGSDAGILYWSRHVADVMGLSQAQGTEIPLDYLLGERFHQVNFDLADSSWKLDGIQHLDQLFKLGRARGDEEFDSIAEQFFSEVAEHHHA